MFFWRGHDLAGETLEIQALFFLMNKKITWLCAKFKVCRSSKIRREDNTQESAEIYLVAQERTEYSFLKKYLSPSIKHVSMRIQEATKGSCP